MAECIPDKDKDCIEDQKVFDIVYSVRCILVEIYTCAMVIRITKINYWTACMSDTFCVKLVELRQ